jgi:hypothetical protein
MNSLLAMRTLLLLALVAASMAAVVQSGLGTAGDAPAHAMLVVARN